MTLSPMLSRMWDACMITLTPVGDPLSTLVAGDVLEGYDVLFEILPRHKRDMYLDLSEVGGKSVGVRMSESEDEEVSDTFFYDRRQGRRLVSGMVIRLQTRDGRQWPLPHPDLLRLHGAIARVVRCAGASGEIGWGGAQFEDEEIEEEWVTNGVVRETGGEEEGRQEEVQWVGKRKRESEMGFALKRFIEDKEGSTLEGKERNKKSTKSTTHIAVRCKARGMAGGRRPALGKRTSTAPPSKSRPTSTRFRTRRSAPPGQISRM